MASPTTSEAAAVLPAIRLDNVSVCYQVPAERIRSLKEYVVRRVRQPLAVNLFWALKDVSLEVFPGEVFGLIGPNGAGKSTLLKVLARVLQPASGRVRLRGRLYPLLELGAGFDPELTGRENIYLNGAILGFTQRDLAARLDRMVAFAGLSEFLDLPLRTYSTGMVARLGFAVATDVQPELLIVDEVLSVGDAEFQAKCIERIRRFGQTGSTILFVSHNLGTVKELCQRAAWLEHGAVREVGPAAEVIAHYEARPA